MKNILKLNIFVHSLIIQQQQKENGKLKVPHMNGNNEKKKKIFAKAKSKRRKIIDFIFHFYLHSEPAKYTFFSLSLS